MVSKNKSISKTDLVVFLRSSATCRNLIIALYRQHGKGRPWFLSHHLGVQALKKKLGVLDATTKNQQNERRGGIRGRTGGPGKDKRTRAPIPISSSSCRHHSFLHRPTSSSLEIWEGQQQASSSSRGDLEGGSTSSEEGEGKR